MNSLENVTFEIEQYARWKLLYKTKFSGCMADYFTSCRHGGLQPICFLIENMSHDKYKIIKCNWLYLIPNAHVSKTYAFRAEGRLSSIYSKPMFT